MDFHCESEMESAQLSKELAGEGLRKKREMTGESPSFLLKCSVCAGAMPRKELEGAQVCGMGQRGRLMMPLGLHESEMFRRHCRRDVKQAVRCMAHTLDGLGEGVLVTAYDCE